MIKRLFLVCFLFAAWGSIPVVAQLPVNTDSLFYKAQVQARLGNYDTSRQLLKRVLRNAPEYTDAALLMGRTFAWQERFDSARTILEPLHKREPRNTAVLSALADVELWDRNPEKALHYADMGLQADANAVPLLLVKARAMQQMQKFDKAKITLHHLLELEPNHAEALKVLGQVRDAGAANLIRADYQLTTFNKGFDAWQLGALEYTRITPKNKYLGRLSYANRYEKQSAQVEIDAYPRLSKNAYLYLNAGFSDGNLFPAYRAGAELFHILPYRFEVSVGARLLSFPEEQVVMYTGQIGKYFQKQWVSFRSFFQQIEGNWQTTGILLLRQYFNHAENHLTLVLAQGSTPLTQVGIEEFSRLGSSRVGLESQFRAGKNFLAGGMFSFEYEEYQPGSFRNRFTFGLTVQRKF